MLFNSKELILIASIPIVLIALGIIGSGNSTDIHSQTNAGSEQVCNTDAFGAQTCNNIIQASQQTTTPVETISNQQTNNQTTPLNVLVMNALSMLTLFLPILIIITIVISILR